MRPKCEKHFQEVFGDGSPDNKGRMNVCNCDLDAEYLAGYDVKFVNFVNCTLN